MGVIDTETYLAWTFAAKTLISSGPWTGIALDLEAQQEAGLATILLLSMPSFEEVTGYSNYWTFNGEKYTLNLNNPKPATTLRPGPYLR